MVSLSKLIQLLGETIKDGRVISLIHKYIKTGVIVGHKYKETTEDVPQGGPLSLILSNIMLTELDRELERRGLPFVHYADNCVIFCKSARAAERVYGYPKGLLAYCSQSDTHARHIKCKPETKALSHTYGILREI